MEGMWGDDRSTGGMVGGDDDDDDDDDDWVGLSMAGQ